MAQQGAGIIGGISGPYIGGGVPYGPPRTVDDTFSASALEFAMKDTAGKTRYDLIPSEAEEQVAEVFTYGAKKYAAHNYRLGRAYSDYFAAARRHLSKWQRGEDLDSETGKSHLAHAICCLMMLLTIQLIGTGKDDRPK